MKKTKQEILNTVEPRSVKLLGFKNSWGDSVGDNGVQWIGEDYFNSYHVWPAWTLVFNKANLVAKLKGDQLSIMTQLLNLLKEQLAKFLGK